MRPPATAASPGCRHFVTPRRCRPPGTDPSPAHRWPKARCCRSGSLDRWCWGRGCAWSRLRPPVASDGVRRLHRFRCNHWPARWLRHSRRPRALSPQGGRAQHPAARWRHRGFPAERQCRHNRGVHRCGRLWGSPAGCDRKNRAFAGRPPGGQRFCWGQPKHR